MRRFGADWSLFSWSLKGVHVDIDVFAACLNERRLDSYLIDCLTTNVPLLVKTNECACKRDILSHSQTTEPQGSYHG